MTYRVAFCLLTSAYWAVAASVVVPNDLQNSEGGGATIAPGIFLAAAPSMRYQQIYPASQFATLPPEGGVITQISFRVDSAVGYNFVAFLPRLQINLSATAVSPGTLSSTFVDNVGLNDTVVFGPGPLDLQGIFLGGSPQPFSASIPLATPFLYVPSAGSLLLDVRNFEPEPPLLPVGPLDASGGMARVYAFSVGAESGMVDGVGLVTRFEIVPVPEPEPLRLGIIAVLVFLAVRLCQTTRQRTKG